MPHDFPALILACVADDAAGAKTMDEFRAHCQRRRDLIQVVGRYAESKRWRRVKLAGGFVIAGGMNAWTDFLWGCEESFYIAEALLELDTEAA